MARAGASDGGGRPIRAGEPGDLLEEPGGGGSSGELPVTGDLGGRCFPPASIDFFVCIQI